MAVQCVKVIILLTEFCLLRKCKNQELQDRRQFGEMLNLEVLSQRSERLRRKNCLFQITEEPNKVSPMGSNRSGPYPGALSQEIQLQDEAWTRTEPRTSEALGMREQASRRTET